MRNGNLLQYCRWFSDEWDGDMCPLDAICISIHPSHSLNMIKGDYSIPYGCVRNDWFSYAKAKYYWLFNETVTNSLIISKFFFDGLVLPCSQFKMLSSETPIMLATSDCISLLSIHLTYSLNSINGDYNIAIYGVWV